MDDYIQIVLCLMLIAACIRPLGGYMARVYAGKRTLLHAPLSWLERGIYKVCGVDPARESGWLAYLLALLLIDFVGFSLLFSIGIFQHLLPLNPQQFPGLSPDLAFNVAVSFITNTNWQSYGGETTLSYFTQMAGCTVQNFLSAAVAMAVAVALFRGIARTKSDVLGNPFVDVTRGIIYILLPLSVLFALFLVSQGVVQNLAAYTAYIPLENAAETSLIAQGPAASQVAIKILGSNGGGFFNVNAAHPFENFTPLSNLLQIVGIMLIPVALVYSYGVLINDRRQGWVILVAMLVMWLPLLWLTVKSEQTPNPLFDSVIVDQSSGNMEGKEQRFGAAMSSLWAVSTTATANGSVNSMHDSFMPLGGFSPFILMQLGGVVFGGVGSGMYTMLMFVILTVFISGLMVGRTPEYMGKKLGAYEIKMASLATLLPVTALMIGAAVAVLSDAGKAAVLNKGAQAFSEILYAFSSAAYNNGSAFAGLSANSDFFNTALGICMFIGRYWVIVPALAVAGSLAAKNGVPVSAGTLPTHTPLFVFMVVGMILFMGVLNFVPALALGPIAEHFHLWQVTP